MLNSQDFTEVEDGLLPVCVFSVWAGGKANGFVACGEVNVEPGDKSMHEIVTADIEGEGDVEGEVSGCAGVEIEGDDCGRVGDNSLDFDCVDKGFSEGGNFERRVVKSIDIVPD